MTSLSFDTSNTAKPFLFHIFEIVIMMMQVGGVAVASDATFPAQLVGWPDLAGLAYLSPFTACTLCIMHNAHQICTMHTK